MKGSLKKRDVSKHPEKPDGIGVTLQAAAAARQKYERKV
jgi:hypothetical protein